MKASATRETYTLIAGSAIAFTFSVFVYFAAHEDLFISGHGIGMRILFILSFSLMYALADTYQLHLEIRSRAVSISISGLPLMAGAIIDPLFAVLLPRALAVFAMVFTHKRDPLRTFANFSMHQVELTLLLFVLDAASGMHGVQSFIALALGVTLSDIIVLAFILGVVSVAANKFVESDTAINAVTALVPISLIVAVVGALLNAIRPQSSFLFVCTIVVVFAISLTAVAGLAVGSSERRSVNMVQDFINPETSNASNEDEMMIKYAIDATNAHEAVIVDLPEGIDEPMIARADHKESWNRAIAKDMESKEVMIVPLTATEGKCLALRDREGRARSFSQSDLRNVSMLASYRDGLSRSRELLERAQDITDHDADTGMFSKNYMLRSIESMNGVVVACKLLSVADVRSTMGEAVANKIMSEAAAQVSQRNEGAIVARIGDDTIGVAHYADVDGAIESIWNALQEEHSVGEFTMQLRIRMGYAFIDDEASVVLDKALIALATACESDSGHEPVQYHECNSMHRKDRVKLAEDLREALGSGDIKLFYQPKVNSDGVVTSCEALARWVHEDRGFVSPEQFVAVAESTGQIGALTRHALFTACRDASGWQGVIPGVGVAVNISASDLVDPKFPNSVRRALESTKLNPKLLTLEVTESGLAEDETVAFKAMEAIQKLGVKMSMDDFGTGYSSLSYLRRLPASEVKIDRAFIKDVATSADEKESLGHIVALIRSMNKTIVAEGVEDQEIADIVKNMGCESMQGYGFSKPVPIVDFIEFAEANIAAHKASLVNPPAIKQPSKPSAKRVGVKIGKSS